MRTKPKKQKVLNPRRATPEQVAAHLSIHATTVLLWMKDGIIPTVVREGRIYRFDLAQIDEVLAARAAANSIASQEKTNGGADDSQ
jgi:predicted DNA-binding transcriptional regulator AlpA